MESNKKRKEEQEKKRIACLDQDAKKREQEEKKTKKTHLQDMIIKPNRKERERDRGGLMHTDPFAFRPGKPIAHPSGRGPPPADRIRVLVSDRRSTKKSDRRVS